MNAGRFVKVTDVQISGRGRRMCMNFSSEMKIFVFLVLLNLLKEKLESKVIYPSQKPSEGRKSVSLVFACLMP